MRDGPCLPSSSLPTRSQTEFSCSTWIGIDSGSTSGPGNDILQAGTHQEISGTPNAFAVSINYYAWWEWWVSDSNPPPQRVISSIRAWPGDTVDVLVFNAGGEGNIQ